jgi:hypothetical protein
VAIHALWSPRNCTELHQGRNSCMLEPQRFLITPLELQIHACRELHGDIASGIAYIE